MIKILAIGDIGNYLVTLNKYLKKSKIHIINFPKDEAGKFTYDDGYELFENYKVVDQVEKINQIKKNYDLALVMGTGERIAYLADLNYISYYVGRDIDAPRFIKNSTEPWYNEPLHKLNFLERKFYKKAFDFAIVHIAPIWVFEHLKKYSNNCLKMDRKAIDLTLFENTPQPISKKKEKFTFFCPQRISIAKGTDTLWKALEYCKTDFKIVQVDWRDITTNEENETSLRLKENLPPQVELIPMIKRKDIPNYYHWADAVIGNLIIGSFEYVELEAVVCKKPVISFTDKTFKIVLEDTELQSPFLPQSNDPKIIAEIIDKIVLSKDFRETLYQKEYEFVREIADPIKAAEWWDSFFEESIGKFGSINRKSSTIFVKFRMLLFLIGNRLYHKKIKKLTSGSKYGK